MAVSSLRYESSARHIEETKGGVFIYDGTADRYNEWTFRTQASEQPDQFGHFVGPR